MTNVPVPTRDRHRAASAVVIVGAAVAILHGRAAADQPTPRVCSISPAADAAPFGPELVSTVRSRGDTIEMLHHVVCDGQPVAWKWLSPSDALEA